MNGEQIQYIGTLMANEDIAELERQAEIFKDYAKKKRNWENAFQKWSNYMGLGEGSVDGYGCCGFGSMCDWCEDTSYGRPCIRALNAMCRELGRRIDYGRRDNFIEVWNGADLRGNKE